MDRRKLLNFGMTVAAGASMTPSGSTLDNTYPAFDLRRYGGVGDNFTANDMAFANWKAACDAANAEGLIPEGQYRITEDIELPKFVRFEGEIMGAFNTVYKNRNGGYISGVFRANMPFLRGLYYCTIEAINTISEENGAIQVDGYDNTRGFFWNRVGIQVTASLTIDTTQFSVNFNEFCNGLCRYIHITGTNVHGYSAVECHANVFRERDASKAGRLTSYGILQDDVAYQTNYLDGVYFEGGSTITGNFIIHRMQGDATGYPSISRFNHALGTTAINARLSKDFLSLSNTNIAIGGDWSIRDSAGKPPSLASSTAGTVQEDITEPSGAGVRYEALFADAFSHFTITLQPGGSDRFGITIFYKSTADFVSIVTNDGTRDINHGMQSQATVDANNDWKMLRICGPASLTAITSVRLYAYTGAGGAGKTMSIGGFNAGSERIIPSPSRGIVVTRYGFASYGPPDLADGTGATTTLTVAGCTPGDFAMASFSIDLRGIRVSAFVSAADTVSVRFQNESGGRLHLESGTLRVQTQSPYA